jgi:hypothetical protein
VQQPAGAARAREGFSYSLYAVDGYKPSPAWFDPRECFGPRPINLLGGSRPWFFPVFVRFFLVFLGFGFCLFFFIFLIFDFSIFFFFNKI